MAKSNNLLEVTMVFGTEAVDALYNDGIKAMKRVLKYDGMMVKKIFKTDAEMQEYFNGINDMDGWNKYAVIYSDGSY